VSFADDDLLLRSKPHNRLLLVTGYSWGQKVKHILEDGRSTVNIMPKSAMNNLRNIVEKLSKSQMMVQGFNLEGQRAIGMIHLELAMDDLSTASIFMW